MLRLTATRIRRLALGLALVAAPCGVHAQLRPLDPLDWPALRSDVVLTGAIGGGRFYDQRAGVAGTEGELTELGNFLLTWHTGRVLLEVAGTMRRVFHDESIFRGPLDGVRGPLGPGTKRTDSGDYRVFTTIVLSPKAFPVRVAARFGTRLPTTDNRRGLDRDATDFYALLDVGYEHGGFSTAIESGMGIIGTRYPEYEQADVMQYAGTIAYRIGPLTPSVTLVGQATTATFQALGTENLAEVRPSVQLGTRRWIRVSTVHGIALFSPTRGVLVSGGVRL